MADSEPEPEAVGSAPADGAGAGGDTGTATARTAEDATRMAVDIGGTFTDLVAVEDGRLEQTKAPTTPEDFASGVVDAIERATVSPASVAHFVHGTTVVINAITERDGVDAALVTTAGFRDVLDITRANRPDMFNFRYEKPEPFVPRRRRFEVGERVDHAGEVVDPLSAADVREAAAAIRDAGLESVAVAYINAHANPDHERRTRELIEEVHPEAYVTLSHELTQEYREYERTNTAVLNAYVRPIADRYLSSLDERLEAHGVAGRRYAMRSNAGTASFRQAKRRPVELVESGPVGGIFGAARLGERIGEPDVISFDMGGTTAKASLVEDGEVTIGTDYWLESDDYREGYPLKVPVVDVVEIGAGGGSIAWIDAGGSLKVGPKSAGADPGPACYGHSERPTVTDANLLTGRLNPAYFLGGEMELDVGRARDALASIADRFDTTPEGAAHGVLRIVNSNMTNALKQVSIRRGYDPREFVLVASGGAGPLHAPVLGRELGVKEVVVPRAPGQFSAWGMLQSDLRRDYIRTSVMAFDDSNAGEIGDRFAAMAERAAAAFADEGLDPAAATLERSADLRYHGQEHTVTTPLAGGDGTGAGGDGTGSDGDGTGAGDDGTGSGGDGIAGIDVDGAVVEATVDRFHDRHERTYNFRLDDPVEVVNLRLTATYPVAKPAITPLESGGSVEGARKGTRAVALAGDDERDVPIYERGRLPVDAAVDGPAVVEEATCTTLVPDGGRLTVDGDGNLHIRYR